MLEILALVYITRIIGALAARKGLKEGRWKLYTVLLWFLAELTGMFTGIATIGMDNMLFPALLGYGLAIIAILILKNNLSRRPDADALDGFDFNKKEEDVPLKY